MRAVDFSDSISLRDKLLIEEGTEAQWCLFDPIVSVIYGLKYQATKQKELLDKQIRYFNRALGQITNVNEGVRSFKCPELYYLESREYRTNDNVPLLWTQANLLMAFHALENSLSEVDPNF